MSEENDTPQENTASSGLDTITETVTTEIQNAHIPPEVLEAQENPEIEQEETVTDIDGILFDKELHATDNEGNPSLTKTGKFRKKRGVSKVAIEEKQKKATEELAQKQGTFQAAQAASAVFISTSQAIFGDEWSPQDLPEMGSEKDMLDGAFYNYFDAKEVKDLPPSLGLTVALIAYSARRIQKPKTKTKLEKLKEKIAGKFYTWNSNRKKAKKNGTLSSSGKDAQRKKRANEANSEKDESAGVRSSGS